MAASVWGGGDSALLERDQEMTVLASAARDAAAGAGRLVVVSGDAGLGKTRLLAVAAERAADAGMTVLRARGTELERGFPFGVAIQLLRRELERAERHGLLTGIAALASPLLRDESAPSHPAEVDAIVQGLSWIVMDIAEREPLALVVDDAHWADDPSLRLVLLLAHRVPDLPVLLVVGSRPREAGADESFLPRLLDADPVRLQPQPLSASAVGELVRARLGERSKPFVEACADVTGGNPLLVSELLAALAEEGVAPNDGVARVHEIGPEPVWRSIELTLQRLPDLAAAVTRWAAVLGEGAELRAVAALAGADLDSTAAAVASLETAGLLTGVDGVGFAHPILRAAVYERLADAERARMHARAAAALRPDATVQRIAAHLLEAPPAGEQWVVDVLREAARHALRRGAPGSAAMKLRRALAEPPMDAQRAEVLGELGRAETAAGAPEACDTLSRAAEATADPLRRAELLLDAGRVLVGRSRFGEAVRVFERGMTELGERDGALRIELEAAWAACAIWIPEIGTSAMQRVAPLLAPESEPRVRGERVLLATLAGIEGLRGDVSRDVLLDWSRRAWGDGALLEGASADDPVFAALTGGFGFAEAFAECDAVATAMIDHARAQGSVLGFATASFLRGGNALAWGRVVDGVADLEQAYAARNSGWTQYVPRAAGLLIQGQLLLGDIERMDELADELPSYEAEHSHSPLWASALEGMGQAALHRGDAERALSLFRAEGEMTEALGVGNPFALPWRSNAALALTRLGRADEAVALCDEEIEMARRVGVQSAAARALRVRGLARGGDGLGDLREAAATAEACGSELQPCLAQLALGKVLRAEGGEAGAREAGEALRRALDGAEAAGARAVAEQAREELRALGARPRRARMSGVDALTPGERRVAQMAAGGLTNRQIAEALFVTPKAVQWHLGNAYRKLGVNSREALGGALGRDG